MGLDAQTGMDDHMVVPSRLAVKSMRDSGYKNAAYAVAELIDNAIQAKASHVYVLCAETEIKLAKRTRRRLDQLAVLDNGSGMSSQDLRRALQFGNGAHLEDRTGIGRFGMGLPNSSISQAQRVEVWTWQKGVDTAIYSYLDVNELVRGEMTLVPEPVQKPVPPVWVKKIKTGKSGTLVVWSEIDRCMWRTGLSIIRNSEFLIGRIYRRFIVDGRVEIRMCVFEKSDPGVFIKDERVVPNDPLYLMKNTSCPAPWDKESMFELFAPAHKMQIEHNGETHTVTITVTRAKTAARRVGPEDSQNPGDRPYGKHAAKNIGVSLMRADRELDLDDNWAIQYNPVERWWGIEVDFPPALDEIFGVTNDKQHATVMADLAKLNMRDPASSGEEYRELKEAMEDEDDPRLPLLKIAQFIHSNLSSLRKALKEKQAGTRTKTDPKAGGKEDRAAVRATQGTRKRQEEGHEGRSDKDEQQDPDKRTEEIRGFLESEEDLPPEEAQRLAEQMVYSGLKFHFREKALESPAFFSSRPMGGIVYVTLNTEHPAYEYFSGILDDKWLEDCTDYPELKMRASKAHWGLMLLLASWARYEDEVPDKSKDRAMDIRTDWGKIAREFMEDPDFEGG